MQEKELTAADIWKMFAETDRQMQELGKKLACIGKHIDSVGKQIGGLSRNAGLHAEQYFQDALGESLVFGGQKYDSMIPNLKYQRKGTNAEFDIVLVNGKSVALIEAKNRIHPDFIKEFVEKKFASFKKYFPNYCKNDVYLGIAGFSFEKEVLEEAKKRGIGIIRQVGKSIEMSKDKLRAY